MLSYKAKILLLYYKKLSTCMLVSLKNQIYRIILFYVFKIIHDCCFDNLSLHLKYHDCIDWFCYAFPNKSLAQFDYLKYCFVVCCFFVVLLFHVGDWLTLEYVLL